MSRLFGVKNFLFALCFISTVLIVSLTVFMVNDYYGIAPNVHFIENNYWISSALTNKLLDLSKTINNNDSLQFFSKYYRIQSTQVSKKISYKLPYSGERLWFVTNGSLMPDPLSSQQLALWPHEGESHDDRVINQLMYVPLNYSAQTVKPKTIYVQSFDLNWGDLIGSAYFTQCPVSSCTLVNRSAAEFADLIFLKGVWPSFKFKRWSRQIWLHYMIESAQSVPYVNAKLNSQINWTATYRHDSDIATPYAKYYPYSSTEIETRNRKIVNYATNKTKLVAWFVSHCNTSNNRLRYALELKKYIQVDIYGECGDMMCSRLETNKCNEMLKKYYKFYLAFENSNCYDYITEKFWFTALGNNMVPIVMGAKAYTYKRYAPPNSFIHVSDFQSPKHLAAYLAFLSDNHREYNRYFEWKAMGEVRDVMMWCRICALLHAPIPTKVYTNITEWWSPKNSCYK